MDPDTVQIDVVVEENDTAFPLDEVAVTAKGADEIDFGVGAGNEIVCDAPPTTSTGDANDVVWALARVPFTPLPQHDAEPSLPSAHV